MLHWIDKEHRGGSTIWLIPCRMDALDRTDVNAWYLLLRWRFCNDIRHDPLSLQLVRKYTNYSALAPCDYLKVARANIVIRLGRSISAIGLELLTKHLQHWRAQSAECVCGRDWGHERYIPKVLVPVDGYRIDDSMALDHGR